ncbi:hypothetical protein PIB30_080351 [Stylosanthes scabra]|uniref:Uncharacterized protein n=1 Tax=Stylosanthes scabra TaxID=79078 RepID=A0ABU6WRA7_9FABA|nr:hypothetical protein [Stylosanthes scabra]
MHTSSGLSREGAGTSCRWLEERCERLEESWKQLTEKASNASRPKIQRIPLYMAERDEFKRYYKPEIISVGPIHHLQKQQLLQGERYKEAWAAMYIKETNQTAKALYWTIRERIPEVLHQLAEFLEPVEEVIPGERGEYLAWMLVVDGCSVLHLLDNTDPYFSDEKLNISMGKLIRVHQDVVILDNQIPFQVLRLLCQDRRRLERCLQKFLRVYGVDRIPRLSKQNQTAQEVNIIVHDDDPIHLLDCLRRALLEERILEIVKGYNQSMRASSDDIHLGQGLYQMLHLRKYRIGTTRELKEAGIRVKKHSGDSNSFYPSFQNGILALPKLTIDGSTAHVFLNLVAYEMCPDFRNDFEISSFLVLLSSLIDHPEDVRELRLAGIVINQLANDKEVADLFNKMDIIMVPETPWFASIRDQIHLHFESKRAKIRMLTWIGEAYNIYFRSPWTVIALLAATLGLVLTFIQTWFAVHPKAS